jgi:hypothetical protein
MAGTERSLILIGALRTNGEQPQQPLRSALDIQTRRPCRDLEYEERIVAPIGARIRACHSRSNAEP